MRHVLSVLIVAACAGASVAADDIKVRGKTVKEWSAALKSPDAKVRYQAVTALLEEGADASPLVKELLPLLKDVQPGIRRAVVQTLTNFKGDAVPAVPGLIAAMKDTDATVRQLAAQALIEIGAPAEAPLVETLNDKDANIRYLVIVAMDKLDLKSKEVAQALGKSVKDASPLVRQAALAALSKLETDDVDVFALLALALGDKEQKVRVVAVSGLMGRGQASIGALVKAAETADLAPRLLALQTLAALAENIDEKGVLALRKALGDDDLKVRRTAAEGLAKLGAPARELGGDKVLFQALVKLLQDKDALLRRTAVHALGQIGSEDPEEFKAVAAAFKDGDALVRVSAVQALARYNEGVIDENTKVLHEHLIEALRDADKRVQFQAAQALLQQGSLVVNTLTRLVEEGKGTQRQWGATLLGQLGEAAIDAVPALVTMSREGNAEERRIALLALQKIQPEVK